MWVMGMSYLSISWFSCQDLHVGWWFKTGILKFEGDVSNLGDEGTDFHSVLCQIEDVCLHSAFFKHQISCPTKTMELCF
jgi:hypothetical protein